jgi:hypothetical protein
MHPSTLASIDVLNLLRVSIHLLLRKRSMHIIPGGCADRPPFCALLEALVNFRIKSRLRGFLCMLTRRRRRYR